MQPIFSIYTFFQSVDRKILTNSEVFHSLKQTLNKRNPPKSPKNAELAEISDRTLKYLAKVCSKKPEMPTKQTILEFLDNFSQKVHKKELFQIFNIRIHNEVDLHMVLFYQFYFHICNKIIRDCGQRFSQREIKMMLEMIKRLQIKCEKMFRF